MAVETLIDVKELVDAATFNTFAARLAETELGSTTASVTFSSIPQIYSSLTIIASVRGTDSAARDLLLRVNGDTGSVYAQQEYYAAAATSVISSTITLSGGLEVGGVNGTNSDTGVFSPCVIDVYDYTTTTPTPVLSFWGRHLDGTTGTTYAGMLAGLHENSAAATSLTLLPKVGSFAAGSVFSLYGWA